MASPKAHIVATAPFVLLEAVFPSESLFLKALRIFIVLFVGVGIDVDHITREGIKDFFAGDWRANGTSPGEVLCYKLFSGWVNYFHTGWVLVGFAVLSYLLRTPWPFATFFLHMLIDGGNEWNQIEDSSPLPKFLYQWLFQPSGRTYTGPKEWLNKPFEQWKEEYNKRKEEDE